MGNKVKFGAFTDLHVDIMHDTEERLREFLDAAGREEVDFVIQLGDFCYPDEGRRCDCRPENLPVNLKNALAMPSLAEKDTIRSLYRDFEKPSFHVIGNHDCDMCSKAQILEYHGANRGAYYSFDFGDFHFVVLDANYFMEDGEYYSYCHGNYFDKTPGKTRLLPFLPPKELKWLCDDLDKTDLPTVIFSHQSLRGGASRAIMNAAEFSEVIKNRRSRVVACFSGHVHIDGTVKRDGVWYIHLNSMSNHWMGEEFASLGRYGEEIDEKYPDIRHVAPYSKALFAIVEIDRDGIRIKGRRGEFVGKAPEELGYYDKKRGRELIELGEPPATPVIENRYLSFSDE